MTDLRKLLDAATKAADNADSRNAESYRLFCAARTDLRESAVNALPALLDIVEAAQTVRDASQSGWADALIKLPSLFAALAQWEKQNG